MLSNLVVRAFGSAENHSNHTRIASKVSQAWHHSKEMVPEPVPHTWNIRDTENLLSSSTWMRKCLWTSTNPHGPLWWQTFCLPQPRFALLGLLDQVAMDRRRCYKMDTWLETPNSTSKPGIWRYYQGYCGDTCVLTWQLPAKIDCFWWIVGAKVANLRISQSFFPLVGCDTHPHTIQGGCDDH